MKNFVLTVVFCFSTFLSYSQYTDVINSNRPGESQTAYAVGMNVFQVETGIYGIREKHNLRRYNANGFGTNYAFRFGYFKEELEFIAELEHKVDYYRAPLKSANRSGLRNVTLGAKYLFFDPYKFFEEEKPDLLSYHNNNRFKWRDVIPAVSIYAGANINYRNPFTFPTDPMFSPKLMVILQSNVYQDWVVVGNIIVDKITTEFPTYGGILTVTKGIHPRLTTFLELKALKSDYYSDGILTGGAAWLVNDKIQLDASISKNIKNTPNLLYGGVGFSWRFDDYYSPVIIPLENEKEKEIREKIEEKKGKVEEIGGKVVPIEGTQDADPENIKEEMEPKEIEEDSDENGESRRRSRRKDKEPKDIEKKKRRREEAPPKEEPTIIDLKNIKRE